MVAVNTLLDLGRAVVATRKSLGLTQEQAAALCGVSMPFMNSLEGGKRVNISLSKVMQVLGALGLRLELAGVPQAPEPSPVPPRRGRAARKTLARKGGSP